MFALVLVGWLLQLATGAGGATPVDPQIQVVRVGGSASESMPGGGQRPAPLGLPLSLDSLQSIKAKLLPPSPTEGHQDKEPPQLWAPPLSINFQATTYDNWFPPDPNIAVGYQDMVVTVNSKIEIYDKSGNRLDSRSLFDFFSPVNPRRGPFDPKVVFDHLDRRFVLMALVRSDSAALANGDTFSYYLVAVSDDSIAIGAWYLWRLDARLDGATSTPNWADYPGLGYDQNAIYLTSNQFRFGGGFQYTKVRILKKSQLYAGSALTWYDFINLKHSGNVTAFTVKPAQSLTPTNYGYFVATYASGGNVVTLWRISGAATNTPTLTRLGSLPIQSYQPPPPAEQQGDTAHLNTGDCRITDPVYYRDGYLYTAFTEARNWGSGNRAALRWLTLNALSASVVTDYYWGASGKDYYYPALAVDRSGHRVVVFARSSASEFVGIRYTGWKSGASGPEASAWLKTGEGPYRLRDRFGRNRWGDYFGAAVDPEDGYTIWVVGEYATNNNRWNTWVGGIAYRPDLVPYQPSGWDASIVPNTSGDATGSSALLPPSLPGEDSVYVSFAWANQGDNPAVQGFYTRLYLDDQSIYTAFTGSLGTTGFTYRVNRGPYFVRGGRHTLWDSVDILQAVLETSEANNRASHQYVWAPLVLSSTARKRPAPPPRYLPGNPFMNNDGYSLGVSETRGWGAVALLPHDLTDDYDLLLYDDYVNSTDGFDTYREWSGRGPGYAEMVLVNRRAGAPYTNYFGAIRYSAGTRDSFTVQAYTSFLKITPSVEVAGDADTLGVFYMGTGKLLILHGLRITLPGSYRLHLHRVSGTAGIGVSIFHKDSAHVRLSEAMGTAQIGSGILRDSVDITFPDTGLYALALWKRRAEDLSQEARIRVILSLLPTNLTVGIPTGWDDPLVARNAADASPGNVHYPDSLPGNAATTYVNFNILNEGPNPAGTYHGRLTLDGVPLASYTVYGPQLAHQTAHGYNWGPYFVRGGRHTLAHEVDIYNDVPETNETDNFYHRQYVWSPLTIPVSNPVVRWEPPAAGTGAQPNSDGFRFIRLPSFAQAVAILPTDSTDDYDLRVYTDYNGPISGFSVLAGWSSVAAGLTDFVVANYLTVEDTVYPAAIRYAAAAGDSFVIEGDHSAGRLYATFPFTTPAETLQSREILEVFEVYLHRDSSYRFFIDLLAPPATDPPGLFLFPVSSSAYYLGRAAALTSSLTGVLVVTAPETGWYPLVVAKSHSRQLDTAYRFRLQAEKVREGTWLGLVSSNWGTADNWAHRTRPSSATEVRIPSWALHMPLITDTARVFSLQVDSAASLAFNGGRLQIMGDSLSIYGRLTAAACTLSLAGNAQLAVFGGGYLKLEGDPAEPVVVIALMPGSFYRFDVFEAGTLAAEYTVFEGMGAAGVNLRPGSYLHPTKALYHCILQKGQSAPQSRLLTLNNAQDLVLEGVRFPDSSGSALYNVYKSLDAGSVVFVNALGPFAGEAHEYDPQDRIQWTVSFVPGDANGDGLVTDADLVYLTHYLYHAGPPPAPLMAGDMNHDCAVTRADLEALAAYLYTGGPPPQPCGTLPEHPPNSSAPPPRK